MQTNLCADSEIMISERHRGPTGVLLNLRQAIRLEFKGTQTSDASQRRDNRGSWYYK